MKPCTALAILWLAMVVASCKPQPPASTREVSEIHVFVNDPDHGLLKNRQVAGLELKVRWIPPSVRARDLMLTMPADAPKDSVLRMCERQIHLVLTLSRSSREDGHPTEDIMTAGIGSQEDYAARMVNMNFHGEEHALVVAGEDRVRPAGVMMENTYGLTRDRDIHFIFSTDDWQEHGLPSQFVFQYDDPEFETGRHNFRFNLADMQAAPQLIF